MNSRRIPNCLAFANAFLLIFSLRTGALSPAAAAAPSDWIKTELAPLTQLYKSLHQTPELSFEEEQTAAKMAAELRRLDFQVTEKVGGHGVVGVLTNGDGPTLLLRADMDALPVVEQTGLDYASTVTVRDSRGATVGVMHACGHDMHMTMLIGTLQYLKQHLDDWRGTVVAVFQPAEERGAGAQAMLDDGLFARFPKPDYALALHVAADRAAGRVAWRTGYAMANVDSVDVTIHGKGGHGAYPHTTVDPIVIAARLVLDLQTIVSREVRPIDPAVVTVGAIHGGAKHNVISDQCKLQLTVRSYTPEVREKILSAIRRKAKAAADSAGAPEPLVEVSDGTPALANDEKLAQRIEPAVRRAVGEQNVLEAEPSMGGEDFGAFGRAGVPILMMSVGAVSQDRLQRLQQDPRGAPSLHSPLFYPDIEPTLTTGVTALAAAALELLQAEH
ncbi:MAG: amidohydrolase [Planctomycetota bacterium]|nr:MAG: amidohydrolase [Planctomycetota bacterium]